MATFWEIAVRSVSNLLSLYFIYLYYLFISRFSFKSGVCLLIAPVPVHCFYITFAAKTYELIFTDERSVGNKRCNDIDTKFAVGITESQERLPTFYWLPKLHKRRYKARFIANSSSCTTTSMS